MANSVSVRIDGLNDLEKKLYELPSKFARKAMRTAIGPAIQLWKDEIQSAAGRGEYATGFMASQVATRVTTSSRDESGVGRVGFTTKQNPDRKEAHVPSASNEAFWKEFGTVHAPARPFVRPAFEAKVASVLDVFTTRLKAVLDEVFGT